MEETGALTGYVDVAQVMIYVFWGFFAALIIYLRREDKREGYPLESDRRGRVVVQGWPAVPTPKTFALTHGGTYSAPHAEDDRRPIAAEPTGPATGAPLEPTGDPMVDGVGPAAWAQRDDHPELTIHGEPRIVPMRVATGFTVEERDPDPRGMTVVGADDEAAGEVVDLWVDRSEPQIRYLEVELTAGGRVLMPLALAGIDRAGGRIRAESILGEQFARVPRHAHPETVTTTEEDQICAYYAGGHLFATEERREPLV